VEARHVIDECVYLAFLRILEEGWADPALALVVPRNFHLYLYNLIQPETLEH
jgi:hypothetical protein